MNPFVIAEIGINHNGDINIAKQLIDIAKAAGCDAVKFQKRTLDVVYTQDYLASPRESPWGTTQREQKEGLEFGQKEYDEIDAYCKDVGIHWLASAWDVESQHFLSQYDLQYNKVASAMLTHLPLLEEIAKEGKHTYISTGMSSFEQIDEAVAIFKKHGCSYTLLHCVSTYPCNDDDCNLNVILSLKERYSCPVGYSGHEAGILPSVLAVALGADTLERHITLDKTMYGSDQSASLEKDQLEKLVTDARRVQPILGDGMKRIIEGELKTEKSLRYFK
ncbi:N-acetylneuraminate synthase family protein [Methanolobus sp. WCC1]|uniref:N-acetylneuraminate synthase family protein n=1 Tax=unclassified Methanolobus TaxID=2629569 RepID=UPI003243DEDE